VVELSLNGDSGTRGYAGEVIVVVNMENVFERTPTIMSVKMRKECPHCGEVVEAERYEGTDENASTSVARAMDALVSEFGDHLELSCEGGDGT